MTSESSTPASQEELQAHKVPLGWRDQCSGYVEFITLLQYYTKDGYTMRSLLIPLNVCRVTEWYMPWKCQNERHAYEECQFKDLMRRMKRLAEEGASEE